MATEVASRHSATSKTGSATLSRKIEALTHAARAVQLDSLENFASRLATRPEAAQGIPGLVQAVAQLEPTVQEIRKRLEGLGGVAANDRINSFMSDMVARKELLEPAEFAERLGWTRQALSKALAARRVFFIDWAGKRYCPAFYADRKLERRHLEAVTKLLGDLRGGAKMQFFLNRRGSLNKLTPLQALQKGQLAKVKALAEELSHG